MKKFCISFLTCVIIVLSVFGVINAKDGGNTEYLRIHVRANSNFQIDQTVKYKVKDAVVEFLTPFIAECDTKLKAERMLITNLSNIESVANTVLTENGFDYKSTAKVNNELFPTRAYGELVLDAGYYDALIIELGDGKGDNWWCVVYPPLCFTGDTTEYFYKSKISQVIKDFYDKYRRGK
jgi:stage II sporulation protein R